MNCEKCKTFLEVQTATRLHCPDCERREISILPDGDIRCVHFMTCPKIEKLREACLKCANGGEGCGLSHTGRAGGDMHMDFDDDKCMRAIASHIDPAYRAARHPTDGPLVDGMSEETEDALRKLLAAIATLTYYDAPIALGLLRRETIGEIGRCVGLSRQTTFARVKDMLRRLPWISALHTRKGMYKGMPKPPKARKMIATMPDWVAAEQPT